MARSTWLPTIIGKLVPAGTARGRGLVSVATNIGGRAASDEHICDCGCHWLINGDIYAVLKDLVDSTERIENDSPDSLGVRDGGCRMVMTDAIDDSDV